MSSALIGKGSKLAYSSDNTTYTDIVEVIEFDFPEVTVHMPDVTNLDSGTYRERIYGMLDTTAFKFSCNYNESAFNGVFALVAVTKYYRLTLTDGSYLKCQGVLSKLGGKVQTDMQIKFDAEIQPIGQLTFSVA
jgi:hypothetical protein